MNKQLAMLTRTVIGMFLILFFAVTMIQFVSADELRANELNTRTLKNSYEVERGAITVDGEPIAYSTPTDDDYRFVREYSQGPLYAPVTGYFSRAQGLTGVEAAMNRDLSGTGDAQFFTRVMNTISGSDPQGSSVELTIDPDAQQVAASAMGDLEGAVVALEPKTGRVLAMTMSPSFDPNLLSTNDDAEIITNYRTYEEDPMRPLMNRAIGGDLYHPGSTYKLLVTATALENGTATPGSEFDNPQALRLPHSSHEMQNPTRQTCDYGPTVSLERALVLSCNIPFAELAMSMDSDAVPKMARSFGFGQDLSIPIPVTPSDAPDPEGQAEVAISSIGQLDVQATPLQMAMVSAGIANDGTVMTPQVVDEVVTPDLRVEHDFSPAQFSKPISAETAETMTNMMLKVVSEMDGTGHNAAISGVDVAGKTGTAENGKDENGEDLPYTLWFTGFAPADDPKIAVAVVIANGGGNTYGYAGNSYEIPTEIGRQVIETVLNK